MKKIKFSFECEQDPMKMEMSSKETRYCQECSRHIHDFTKLTPEQFIQLKKSDPKLCGFMMPWQLDEINAHLAQQKKSPSVLSNWVKAAAIAGAPLMATQGFAQQKNTSPVQVEYNINTENNPCTEIMLRNIDGKPITNITFHVLNGEELLEKIQPDSTGKLSFNHTKYKAYSTLRIWQPEYKIEQQISVKRQAICTVWEIDLSQLIAESQLKNYDFKFVYRDEHDKAIKLTDVEIELFDSTNTSIKTYYTSTNIGGYANLKVSIPKTTKRLYFTLKTKDGNKRAYLHIDDLQDKTENIIRLSKHFRHKMGRLVTPRF